jgi:hypothetical protein
MELPYNFLFPDDSSNYNFPTVESSQQQTVNVLHTYKNHLKVKESRKTFEIDSRLMTTTHKDLPSGLISAFQK